MLEHSPESRQTDIVAVTAGSLPGDALLGPVFGGPPVGAPPATANVGWILDLLWRYKCWAAAVFFLIAASGLPLVWLLRQPSYQATASIRVRPIIERIAFSTELNGTVPLYSSFVNTQVSVIRSPLVLSRVLNRDDVRQTSWCQAQASQAVVEHDRVLENMLLGVDVGPRRGTELIDVTVAAGDPAEAKLLADAIVDEYRRYVEEVTRAEDVARHQTLEDELLETESLIDGTITAIQNVSEGLGTDGSADLRSQSAGHLKLLEAQRDHLKRELELTRWELQSLRAAGVQDAEATETHSGPHSYALDLEWRKLQIMVHDSENKLRQASTHYGQHHPRMRQLSAQVQHGRRLLAERQAQLNEQVPGALQEAPGEPSGGMGFVDRSTLGHLEGRQAYELQLLDGDIERYRKEQRDAQKQGRNIAGMHEDLRRYRKHAETLQGRREILDVESKAPARVSVAYFAMKPTRPHKDRRVLLSLMVLAGAAAGGLGVAYLRGTMDQTIRVVGDVRETGNIPFLGQVPELSRKRDPVIEGDGHLAENIRMIRTALLKRMEGRGKQAVLVTSSISHNGKTSVAILLARSLAHIGKRVLLVEGDLRKPALARRLLGHEPQIGLARLLEGHADDATVILPSGTPHLDVVPAGTLPAGFDFEKMANGRFSDCLQRWKSEYDLVLLDSPPVLPVADARILAGQADGTVMVLRASHCARGDVLKAYSDISAAGGVLLGTVLVGGHATRGYGRQYSYGYGYGPELNQLACTEVPM